MFRIYFLVMLLALTGFYKAHAMLEESTSEEQETRSTAKRTVLSINESSPLLEREEKGAHDQIITSRAQALSQEEMDIIKHLTEKLQKHLSSQGSTLFSGDEVDKSVVVTGIVFGAIMSLYNYDLGQQFWQSRWDQPGFYKPMAIISFVPLAVLGAQLTIDVFGDFVASCRISAIEKILTNQACCSRRLGAYVWDGVGLVSGSLLSIGGIYLTYTYFDSLVGNWVYALLVPTYTTITSTGLWALRKTGMLLYEFLQSKCSKENLEEESNTEKRKNIHNRIVKFKKTIAEMEESEVESFLQQNCRHNGLSILFSANSETELSIPAETTSVKKRILQIAGSAIGFIGAWGPKSLTDTVLTAVLPSVGVSHPTSINILSETISTVTWITLGSLVGYSMYSVVNKLSDYFSEKKPTSMADIGFNTMYLMTATVSTASKAQVALQYVDGPFKYPLAVFNVIGRMVLDYWSMNTAGNKIREHGCSCAPMNVKQKLLKFVDEVLLLLSKMDKKYVDILSEYMARSFSNENRSIRAV